MGKVRLAGTQVHPSALVLLQLGMLRKGTPDIWELSQQNHLCYQKKFFKIYIYIYTPQRNNTKPEGLFQLKF